MSSAGREQQRRVGLSLDVAAPPLALAAALLSLSIVHDEPWSTLWLLFVPAAVAALPLTFSGGGARRAARIVAAVLLVVWCVLAAASVGLFYLPAALAMIAAAIRGRRA